MAFAVLPPLASLRQYCFRSLGWLFAAVVFSQVLVAQENGTMVEVDGLRNEATNSGQVGRLVGWSQHAPLMQGEQGAGELVEDWIRVSFFRSGATHEGNPFESWRLELADSSQLRGRPAGGDADRLLWAWGSDADLLLIPIDLLWLRGFARERLPRADADQESDLLDLRTRTGGLDRRTGWLEELSNEGLRFVEGEREFEQEWARVAGLRLLEEELAPRPTHWELLEFVDGSSLPVAIQSWGETHLTVDLLWGGAMSVPHRSLRAIWRGGGGGADLTELAGRKEQFEAGKVLSFAPRAQRNVSGLPLSVAGRTFGRGLGVRAPTSLSWQLNEAGVFHCWVGVDDAVQSHRDPAPLNFQVWLEGEMLMESGPIKMGEEAVALRTELPRAGKLELRCLSVGAEGASGRHGNWIHPRIWPSLPSGL